ncbi:MAG: MBL fold metallo-hydrolase [Elusimicrobia bacterium]|nr:MBL fold metallo-hydrolase [Elusimicrobiota bacterium]
MKVTFWGCRGSIPTPGPDTLRHGGNTTCLELRDAAGKLLIVDAGSGIRLLGKTLLHDKTPAPIRFFLTHSHWDHLMGFPFFEPAYHKRFSFLFCGGSHAQDSIKRYLGQQMQAPFFPVDFSLLKAGFAFRCERPHGEEPPCRFDSLEVYPIPLSHPNGGYGFKFVEAGRSFVFLTDNELGLKHPGGLKPALYEEFCRGADLLVHDSQYTEKQYGFTRGWGHSTFNAAVDLAAAAGVKRLGLFHHDPDRSDDDLDRQTELCKERLLKLGSSTECFATAERMTLDL